MSQFGALTLYVRRYTFPALTVLLFAGLFALAVFQLLREAKNFSDELIAQDVQRLGAIFKKIDDDCKIISFDYQKNNIDFLTVEKFVSSEIGPMNLMTPEKWHGPYLPDNPTIQGKVYQVVRTIKGYFIVPGDGVRLSNGKTVGVDIALGEQADIAAMTRDPQVLSFRGQPLAIKIGLGGVRSAMTEVLLPDTGY